MRYKSNRNACIGSKYAGFAEPDLRVVADRLGRLSAIYQEPVEMKLKTLYTIKISL